MKFEYLGEFQNNTPLNTEKKAFWNVDFIPDKYRKILADFERLRN
jgi:hypothetical protein